MSAQPKESEVQSAILRYLKMHPKVAFAERFNSGGMYDKTGRFLRFNTLDGCPDILGQMRHTGSLLACEVKRPGWIKPKDKHEHAQADFIARVKANGGVGFFATSVEDVERELSL